jgi:multidrug resistance efflux pump
VRLAHSLIDRETDMNARKLAARVGLIVVVWLTYGCTGAGAARGAPTPLPVVADLGGVKTEGRVEPIRYVELSPTVTGLVSDVLVSEGDNVTAGQLIATLETTNAETLEMARNQAAIELGNAHDALRLATQKLDDYPVPRVFVGLTAEAAARTWLRELDAARVAFEPYKDTSRKTLKPSHVLSRWVYPSLPRRVVVDTKEYDEMAMVYEKRLDVAWANYTKAVEWLKLEAAVTQAQARVDDAQRRYESLQDELPLTATAGTRSALASAEIRAPFAGTVTRLNVKAGQVASAGVPVATVADLSGWIVKTTDLTEIDVADIHIGNPATIVFDAMPEEELAGHVNSIDLTYTDREGDVLYPVDVKLEENKPWLRWGMTAEVTFGT